MFRFRKPYERSCPAAERKILITHSTTFPPQRRASNVPDPGSRAHASSTGVPGLSRHVDVLSSYLGSGSLQFKPHLMVFSPGGEFNLRPICNFGSVVVTFEPAHVRRGRLKVVVHQGT